MSSSEISFGGCGTAAAGGGGGGGVAAGGAVQGPLSKCSRVAVPVSIDLASLIIRKACR